MRVGIVLLWFLNFGISWLNAWSVGRAWNETKYQGGWARFLHWCTAIMSASGFTWCYLILVGEGAFMYGKLTEPKLQLFFELGYTVIIFPILGSGLAMTIDAWMTFWRRRTIGSGAVAAWDTFAQVYNTYEAAKELPGIFEHVKDALDTDDNDGKGKLTMLVVMLVAIALAGGVLTTYGIVRVTARNAAYNRRMDAETAYRRARMGRQAA